MYRGFQKVMCLGKSYIKHDQVIVSQLKMIVEDASTKVLAKSDPQNMQQILAMVIVLFHPHNTQSTRTPFSHTI